ncbi:MAG: ATP-dependent helicase [Deltaproteobacteria bacterium]|nr:ATP-dependent helicase [Deltaproteobacteria bacterium]
MRRYSLQVSEPKPAKDAALVSALAKELNPEQLAVATAGGGPILVLAGAGSGKTRALTYRVAYLLKSGVPADQILLLTFTNKAAREMLQRACEVAGLQRGRLDGGTFHHVGLRFLRDHTEKLGYGATFTILDREDAGDLLAACVVDAGIDPAAARFPKSEVLAELYSKAVNTRTTIHETILDHYKAFEAQTDAIIKVLVQYVQKKRALSVMDFDDMLLEWRRLFVEHPDVGERFAAQYKHVLVDEYQDTNRLQGELCDLVSQVHKNLLVVGDDAQSIYGFRGAARENILGFSETHPGCKIFKLETNYRSRPEILALANASLQRARSGYEKTLRPTRDHGMRPALVRARDEQQQASFVAQRILELRDEGMALDDISILYRAHYQSLELQIELGRRGIPFVVRSGVKFFETAHVKDVLCAMKSLYNPQDELAFRRVLRMLPGVGHAAAEKLFQAINGGQDVHAAVPKRSQRAFATFWTLYSELKDGARSPAELIDRYVRDFYGDYLQVTYDQAEMRKDDLSRLAEYAAQFATLEAFLADVALVNEISSEHLLKGAARDEAVVLSSVHQAKGLEWRAVFVIWLADGKFPSQPSIGSPDAEDEERRLFYVAVTRAMDELYLCWPLTTVDRSRRQVLMQPSRFIVELQRPAGADELYEAWQLEEAFTDSVPRLDGTQAPALPGRSSEES